MDELARDLNILSYATHSLKWMRMLRQVVTVGAVLFAVVEGIRLCYKNRDMVSEKLAMFH